MELYNFIQKVDQAQDGVVQNCDVLCDLLYPLHLITCIPEVSFWREKSHD